MVGDKLLSSPFQRIYIKIALLPLRTSPEGAPATVGLFSIAQDKAMYFLTELSQHSMWNIHPCFVG